ncbi:MAG: serine hydrolase domain-containing protein [Chloroflexota bacterium]
MTIDAQHLAEVVQETARRLDVAGAQVTVWDGTELTQASTGIANAETGEEVSNDTLFQIGSTTKLYAAALALQLVDEGRADLDEPILSYLPDFRLADPEATQTMTLRLLHSMSNGMDNGPYTDFGPGDDCVARYVESIADIPQLFPPGTGFAYSNASTTLAGRITEVLTGLPWEAALRDRLLVPAGLDSTRSLYEDLIYRQVAVGHIRADRAWKVTRPWQLPRSLCPGGSTLCATASDLVRFGRIMLNEGRSENGNAVLSPSAVRIMHEPVVETPTKLLAQRWCVGAYSKRWGDVTMFGHSGTNASSSSMLLWAPERNVVIASIANVPALGYPFAYAVFAEVLSSTLGFGLEPVAEPDLDITIDGDRYIGRYIAHGISYDVAMEAGHLTLAIRSDHDKGIPANGVRSSLSPLARDRFLPESVSVSGGRGWDVAFVDSEGTGRATHIANGVMVARRAASD